MPEISSVHLSEILKINTEIDKDVKQLINHYLTHFHLRGWNRIEGAMKWMRDNHFVIQAPIKDSSLGGFILYQNQQHICYINTYHPRVYQNFILFHELYHVISQIEYGTHKEELHVVESDLDRDKDERKADYFASLLLLEEERLISFYQSLLKEEFLVRILYTMSHFSAPYKAVLIRLYELQQIDLDKLVEYFDLKINLEKEFINLGFDPAPVQRSNSIDFSQVEKLINENTFLLPEIATESNKKTLEGIRNYFKQLKVE
ncbi:ImmA/IrrE family metallo-endopeptidase [Heyndrickxia oleronia]|jgi:Zn-dependent peptidase ImmA (M78 family)|uniref:ImmA/IrrE family metallo-endopeptidase n=1 Tax=Heyndrickxia oleronia TaxID=38875 RepID=UPI0037511B2F